MKATYTCGTCGKDETISGAEMPQIELWRGLVVCDHPEELVRHSIDANYGFYPTAEFDDAASEEPGAAGD